MSNMFPSRSKSVSSASSSSPKDMEGTLEKKNRTFGSARYHCFLQDGKLWCSDDKGRQSFTDISRAQSIREGKARHSFEIITSSKTKTFTADSQEWREKWIAALREAMRVASRKSFSQSFAESVNSDEEESDVMTPQSPFATQSSVVKPRSGASLPPEFIKRTIPFFKTETKRKTETPDVPERSASMSSRFYDTEGLPMKQKAASEAVNTVEERDESTSEGKEDAIPKEGDTKWFVEIKDEPQVLKEDDNKSTDSSSGDDTNMIKSAAEAKEDDKETVMDEDDQIDEINVGSGDSVRDEIITISPNSLYANNADIKKFLFEKAAAENSRLDMVSGLGPTSEEPQGDGSPPNAYADVRIKDFANEPELCGFDEQKAAQDWKLEDPEDIFPPSVDQPEEDCPVGELKPVKSSAPPVVRRRSELSTSEFDFPSEDSFPEPTEVELKADFCPTPIPDLPHPRSEPSLAFSDIRVFLSENYKMQDNGVPVTSVSRGQLGCGVESLKHFLNNMKCS